MLSIKKMISILILTLILVGISGCTSQDSQNEFPDQNMRAGETIYKLDLGDPIVCYKYIMLPAGTKSVIIEYNNLTSKEMIGINSTYFQFASYNVVAQHSQEANNSALNVNKSNIIDIHTINTTSKPISGKLTLNIHGAKSIGIINSFAKGNVVVIIN